ncbi:MAG: DNA polymerase III subunit delta [Polymorphobacter sp.]
MKVDAARIQAIARQWPTDIRLVLLHGQDAAASRDYADQIARQFADAANPMAVESLTGATIASDPQALVGAAGTVSMFGDRTLVRVDGVDDDGLDAVTALLASPAGNPVIAVAGTLKKGSKLQAFADKMPGIAALISYEPGLRDALRLVTDIGAPMGLRVAREAATALFESAGGDRTIIRREVEKLSLYLDSAADRQKTIELADVEAVGVGVGGSDQFALGAAVAGGRMAIAADLLARLPSGLGIVALRAVERRLTLLLTLRGVVDGGASPQSAVDGARPPIFWKEKEAVAAELSLWTTAALVRGLADILAAERAIKSPGSLGDTLAEAAILTLARRAAAARRR